jgi:hypothetical protein
VFEEHPKINCWPLEEIQYPGLEHADWHRIVFFAADCWCCVYFSDERGLPWSVLLGEPCHLPFHQLLDPVCQLEVLVAAGHNEVGDLCLVVELVPLRLVTNREGNMVSIDIQALLQVLYFVNNELSVSSVPLFLLLDGGNESIMEGDPIVLMEGHQVFSGP